MAADSDTQERWKLEAIDLLLKYIFSSHVPALNDILHNILTEIVYRLLWFCQHYKISFLYGYVMYMSMDYSGIIIAVKHIVPIYKYLTILLYI